jgi:hypothetical protein
VLTEWRPYWGAFSSSALQVSVLISDGEKKTNTRRLFHSLGDSIECKIHKQRFTGDSIEQRYAPMNKDYILGFPNKMPQVNWQRNLPIFQDENVDDALLHLIKFHIHSWKLKVEWHEDCHMKMFMETLEGKARKWYEGLNLGRLFSLKDFHIAFYEHYKEYFPSLSLVENYWDQFEDFI